MIRKSKKNSRKDSEICPKPSFAERMGNVLDIPADLLRGGCYMEMRGQNELRLQGCRQILVYTAEEIVLRLRRGAVRVSGRRMICSSYHAGCAVIEGWIEGVSFVNMEERV